MEKLKAGLEAMLAGLPDEQREPAERGFEAALEKVRLEQARRGGARGARRGGRRRADEEMFSALRRQLGLDEAVAVSVGAAPTPVEVLEFFHAIGIPVGELWGMSETCGVATCNPPEKIKLGTVGPPVPGVEMKLADDGEVLVRSDANMPGYRNMPEKTAETIDAEGWLHTGDIGELDEDGYLSIVDRKKELIINAAGKNMSPASIESKLKAASPLIGQAIAIGDGRRYNVALIVLDPDYAPVWAQQQGIEDSSTSEQLAEDEALDTAIGEAVEAANERMARVEQIKKFKILPGRLGPRGRRADADDEAEAQADRPTSTPPRSKRSTRTDAACLAPLYDREVVARRRTVAHTAGNACFDLEDVMAGAEPGGGEGGATALESGVV